MNRIVISTIIFVGFILTSCNQSTAKKSRDLSFLDNAPNLYADKVVDSLKHLIPILDTILRADQKFRTEDLYMKNLFKQNRIDSENVIKVTGIIDRYGWLGMKDIGFLGYSTINIVMTHASTKCKLKYQPIMVDAVLKKKVMFADYALFEDKINFEMNRYQYYGSQLFDYKNRKWPHPIYKPDSVDQRRSQFIMGTMNQYLASFNTTWNIDDYNKILPELIKVRKVSDTPSIHFSFK